jgi:transposase
MDVISTHCCGLDVHKRTVVACLITPGLGKKRNQEIRTFGTTTPELLQLADWLMVAGCTHVAMESTGVYWKPVFNLLESSFEVMVVNAQHIKAVPGRKTDVNDAEWIADLLQHGLLKASFIPNQDLRELREAIRYRKSLVQIRSGEVSRLQKFLEGANIKLSSVATDIMGVSGRAMLQSLVDGERNAGTLAQLAKGRLKKKEAALRQALDGRVNAHTRFMLKRVLDHIDFLQEGIATCELEIAERMEPVADQVERLVTIPGVSQQTARLILAEIGTDMNRFPTHKHLASWAGVCPGNNESAGKQKTGKTRKGSRWLRAGLVEAARAAGLSKKNYLSALYHRLRGRRGPNKAAMGVAHAILVIAYHLLKDGTVYQDLGTDHFDRLDPERTKNRFVKRLESMGYQVSLTSAPPDPSVA